MGCGYDLFEAQILTYGPWDPIDAPTAARVMYRKLALIRANEEVGRPANCTVMLLHSGGGKEQAFQQGACHDSRSRETQVTREEESGERRVE